MTWETFYLICFIFGLCASLFTFFGGLGHAHHAFLRHHVHAKAGAARAGGHLIPPVNGFTVVAFLAWFGATGYLLERYGGVVAPLVLLLAVAGGLIGASLLFWFLARVLLPHEHELTAEETATVGVVGHVSSSISPGGTGEILFSQGGSRRFSPARSDDGREIATSTEVIVMRYERGIAYVRRWDEMVGDLESAPSKTRQDTQFS
jgi:hypothetical protein